MTTVFRCQHHESGFGPWVPGWSHTWVDPNFKRPLGILQEFGDDVITKNIRANEIWGTGVLELNQMKKWFNTNEMTKLFEKGYAIVEMQVDRIIAKSEHQIVFARAVPLSVGAKIVFGMTGRSLIS